MDKIDLILLIEKFEKTGRTAHLFPKLKKVSFNGKPSISYKEAIEYLNNFFKEME